MTNIGYYLKMKNPSKKVEKQKKENDSKIKKVKFPDNVKLLFL